MTLPSSLPASSAGALLLTGYGAWLAEQAGAETWWTQQCRQHASRCPLPASTALPLRFIATALDEALDRAGLPARPLERRRTVLLAGIAGQPIDAQPAHFLSRHLHFIRETEEYTDTTGLSLAPRLLVRAAEWIAAERSDAVIVLLCDLSPGHEGVVALVFESPASVAADQIPTIAGLDLFDREKNGVAAVTGSVHSLRPNRHILALDSKSPGLGATSPAHPFAALLGAAMAVERGIMPPFATIDDDSGRPNSRLRPWFTTDGVRIARIRFDGPPALHGLISATTLPAVAAFPRPAVELFAFSAATPTALCDRLAAIAAQPTGWFERNAAAASCDGPVRAAVVCDTPAALAAVCRTGAELIRRQPARPFTHQHTFFYSGLPEESCGQIAMLFPGQGSQYPHMNRDVLFHFPSYRARVEAWNHSQAVAGEGPIADWIYPDDSTWSQADRLVAEAKLTAMEVGGQGATIASLGMYRLLESFGAKPDCLAGYSNGENVALFASGMLPDADERLLFSSMRTLQDLVRPRANTLAAGAMLAVSIGDRGRLTDLLRELDGRLFLALDNCPGQVVLFATHDIVAQAVQKIQDRGGLVLRLPFDRPFHTPLYHAAAEKIRRMFYDNFALRPPQLPVYSSGLAAPMPHEPEAVREALTSLWHRPVRFRETVERMYADGVRVFIEVGPGAKLTGYVDDILRGRPHAACSASSERRPGLANLLGVAALLYVCRRLSRAQLHDRLLLGQDRNVPSVPAPDPAEATIGDDSPREARDVWTLHLELMDEFLAGQQRVAAAFAHRRSLGSSVRTRRPNVRQRRKSAYLHDARHEGNRTTWTCRLDAQTHPFLRDHAFGGRISERRTELAPLAIVPLAYSLEIALDAACEMLGPPPGAVQFGGTRALRWISAEKGSAEFAVRAERLPAGVGDAAALRIVFTRGPDAEMLLETELRYAAAASAGKADWSPRAIAPVKLGAGDYYHHCLFHGETLRAINRIRRCDATGLEADVSAKTETRRSRLPVALLDALGQLTAYWLIEAQGVRDFAAFPVQIRALTLHAPVTLAKAELFIRAQFARRNSVVDSDLEIIDPEGRPVISATQFQSRVFALSSRYLAAIRWQRPDFEFSTTPLAPGAFEGAILRSVDARDHPQLGSAGDFWLQGLALMTLGAAERRIWFELGSSSRRKLEWLLGRIAAKDAVREWARRIHRCRLFLADVEILPDAAGRPTLHCPELAAHGPTPAVSITHSDGIAFAAVRHDGGMLGVDFESVYRQRTDAELLSVTFTEEERRILGSHPLLAGWVAKEAAAKAGGVGLQGNPRRWNITATGESWGVEYDGLQFNVAVRSTPQGWLALACPSVAGSA